MSNMEVISIRVRDVMTKDPICCYPKDIEVFHDAPYVSKSWKRETTRCSV